ncbi:MAG: hypothetical protein ACI8RZ_006795 [Myxococcota bacterium]|jgi:hypothetical protein
MVLLLPMVLGCKDKQAAPLTDTADEVTCASGDWWSAGQPLMLDFCAGCHSSHLTGDARFGAPDGVDLETLEGALQHTDRIEARALESGDMPPGGGMSAAQLERLSAWLACENQEANPLPLSNAVMPEITIFGFTITVTDEDGWHVLRREETSGQVWSEEYYLIDGSNVWFGGYSIFEPTLFGTTRSLLFEPLIQMTSQQESDSWTASVTAELEEDGVVTTQEQTWSVSYGNTSTIDGRSVDRNPTEVMMVADSGEVHVWHLSETRILSSRWIDTGETLFEALRLDHYSPDIPQPVEPFPFESGDTWLESTLMLEGVSW